MTIEKMNRKANASTKSKEVQPPPKGKHKVAPHFILSRHTNNAVKFIKRIWRKIQGLFLKRPPSTEEIISEEKAVLTQTIVKEEIYTQIQESIDVIEKSDLIKKIAKHNTAKAIIHFVENDMTLISEKKNGKKKIYELHELRNEIQILEEQKAILDFKESQIKQVINPDTSFFDIRISNLFKELSKNNIDEKIKLTDISISTFDNSFQQLDKLLKDKSALQKHIIREREKKKQREIYESNIKKELNNLEALINQNKLNDAKLLINQLSKSIKPDYKKGVERLSKSIAKLKDKELQIFKKQQEELLRKQAEEAEKIRIAQEKFEEERQIAREQAEALRKIEEDKKAEKERKLKALLSKKANWRDFQRVLQQNGITAFYHFTDTSNLKSIKDNNGLYSWHYADSSGIIITFPGGDTLSRDLDKRYGLQDYVRVSFCTDHPMQFRLEQRGRSLVLLKVDVEVAYFENTIFCNINATDSNHEKGQNIEDLERIRFSATKRTFVSREDSDFKYHQAEVLVKTWIPLEYITNINSFA